MRIFGLLFAALVIAGCSASLKSRLDKDLESVNYADGVDQHEADILAQYYRLNNLKWLALDQAQDDGDYWSYRLLNAQTREPIDAPPLRVYKKAWSYKSAVVFDRRAY